MLGKLLKYEIRATARIFLPLYAVLLVFAAIHRIIDALSPSKIVNAPQVISTILYVIIVVAVFVATLIVMIQRFYKNLLSDEGYLMFTLPVRPWQHIVCKLLISMMWSVVSVIAAFLSVWIVAGHKIPLPPIETYWRSVVDEFSRLNLSSSLFIVEFLITCVIGLAGSVLIIYASIALGHLFNKHRVLASLGAYIVLTTATQIIFAIAGTVAFLFDGVNPEGLLIHLFIWLGILFFGLIAAGYFAITNYILNRRLNLE